MHTFEQSAAARNNTINILLFKNKTQDASKRSIRYSTLQLFIVPREVPPRAAVGSSSGSSSSTYLDRTPESYGREFQTLQDGGGGAGQKWRYRVSV